MLRRLLDVRAGRSQDRESDRLRALGRSGQPAPRYGNFDRNMGASLYEPINVYKPLAPDIGIVDGPFEYLTVGGIRLPLPFTTRMTVVRLSNGDLFLHSPIKFDERLAKELHGAGDGSSSRVAQPIPLCAYRGMGEGVSRNDCVGITTCAPTGTGPARGYRLYKRPRRQCAGRMAWGDRPTAFSRRLFQGVHFLPQGFEDADTH